MPYEIVAVESNIDRINERSVHSLFKRMVERLVDQGERSMRELAPKDSGLMAARIGHHGPDDAGVGDLIWADVGVPRIPEADARQSARAPFFPGEQDSGDYPLFVARGTGIFGPASAPIYPRRARAMVFDGADGNPVFARRVKGQQASHFMLDTFELMRSAALPVDARIFAEQAQHLYAIPAGSEL